MTALVQVLVDGAVFINAGAVKALDDAESLPSSTEQLGERLWAVMNRLKPLDDTEQLAETLVRVLTMSRTIDETVQLAENTDTQLGVNSNKVLNDAENLVEATDAIVYREVGMRFLYTAAKWGRVSVHLEATMAAVTGFIRARLYDVTSAAEVTGSVVVTNATTPTRVRSGALALTNGNEYACQVGYSAPAGSSGYVRGGGLRGVAA